jgi:NADH-quinone oxidoreductase subunit M
MQFPIISIIVFTPILAGMLILLIPGERKAEVRVAALAAAALTLILSIWVFTSYDTLAGGYQFQEKYDWLPVAGISYFVGVDGMSAPLILLTGIVMFTGVLISWNVDDRPREFFAFLFILATGVFGVFASLDLFLLIFFYEIAVFPMYLLISIWGWKVTREYAAMKLTLYLFIGSVIALVGALAMYFTSGLDTFNMLELESAGFSPQFQVIVFPFVFFGFAILGGIFPFHNWSPDGHVAAPTAVSMFHAGVLMKLGAFAALRVGIMLLPDGARVHLPWIIGLSLINVVYGAFIAMVQKDFKYVIGFSSVSHMGLVIMGFATLTHDGFLGAGLQMFSHGIMTALFFAVVGMIYDRAHTREIPQLGGFARVMPLVAVGFIIGGLVSMGMPGFSGFIAEFPIFMGIWGSENPYVTYEPIIAVIAVISIVVTAGYIFRIIGRVFFGEMPKEFAGHIGDVSVLDKVAVVFLCLFMVGIGILPRLMVPVVESGVDNIMRLLGG